MTEGGKNYKLDELIGYYLINLYYINNSTNPNLFNNLSIYAKTELKTNLQNGLIFTHRHNCTNFSHKQTKIKKFYFFLDNRL